MLGDNPAKYTAFSKVCLPKYPMDRSTISLVYDIIQAASNGDGTYTFVSLDSATKLDSGTVTFTHDEVFPSFSETSALIQYDDVEITTAVDGVPVVVGTKAITVLNNLPTCTRYVLI